MWGLKTIQNSETGTSGYPLHTEMYCNKIKVSQSVSVRQVNGHGEKKGSDRGHTDDRALATTVCLTVSTCLSEDLLENKATLQFLK